MLDNHNETKPAAAGGVNLASLEPLVKVGNRSACILLQAAVILEKTSSD